MKLILSFLVFISLSSAQATDKGWGDIFGEILNEALSSPEVTGAICSTLPEEFQKACQAGVGDPVAREKALGICSDFSMSESEIKRCYKTVSSGNFQSDAVDLCASMSFADGNDQIKCLSKINNRSFDKSALGVCKSMWDESDKLKCIDAISQRIYSEGVAKHCSSQWEDSDKISCLKELGM